MPANDYTVELEERGAGGRYLVRLPDGEDAEMTFRRLGPDTIAIDHTGVPHAHRGAGIALKLVERAIADARASGTKIVPYCSYVEAQFRRHPEWADLRASR